MDVLDLTVGAGHEDHGGQIIDLLQQLLAKARRGEVTGVAYGAVTREGLEYCWRGLDLASHRGQLLGALELARQSVVDSLIADSGDADDEDLDD